MRPWSFPDLPRLFPTYWQLSADQTTKVHRVPIRNIQVMAIWKFRYRQLFGKSVKKWLDRYQTLQPHADAWKGPAYQIIAWSVRNCQSYPIFSLLVGRSVGGVARPQFFLFCSPKTWQEHPTYVPEHIADISETKIENWFSSTILVDTERGDQFILGFDNILGAFFKTSHFGEELACFLYPYGGLRLQLKTSFAMKKRKMNDFLEKKDDTSPEIVHVLPYRDSSIKKT